MLHYYDVIMVTMASQITSLTIVYSTVHEGADQRKHQSSASLAFVRRIHQGSLNSPHKWSVTRKMFLFLDVIMSKINGLMSNLRIVFQIREPLNAYLQDRLWQVVHIVLLFAGCRDDVHPKSMWNNGGTPRETDPYGIYTQNDQSYAY